MFNQEIEKASENQATVIVMGDANMCAEKWLSSSHKFHLYLIIKFSDSMIMKYFVFM